jgi:hypothetical protein
MVSEVNETGSARFRSESFLPPPPSSIARMAMAATMPSS